MLLKHHKILPQLLRHQDKCIPKATIKTCRLTGPILTCTAYRRIIRGIIPILYHNPTIMRHGGMDHRTVRRILQMVRLHLRIITPTYHQAHQPCITQVSAKLR